MIGYVIFGWLFVGFILFVAEFYRADEEPQPKDEYAGMFTPEEATELIALKERFNELEEIQK